MNKKRILSLLSLLMVLTMLLAQAAILSSCKKPSEDDPDTTTSGDSETTPEEELEEKDPFLAKLKYYDTTGKTVLNANFCKDMAEPTVPALYALTGTADGAPSATIGAIWNAEELRLSLSFDKADKLTVTVNDHKTEITDLSGKTDYDLTVAFSDTGITPQDLGQIIPMTASIENDGAASSFDGFLQLADYEVCFASSADSLDDFTSVKTALATGAAVSPEVAGVECVNGDIRLYDKFVAGRAQAYVQHRLVKSQLTDLKKADSFIFETDITVDAMPEMQPTFVSATSTYGLYFCVAAANSTPSFMFGLNNIEGELVFAAYDENGSSMGQTKTGKLVGDSFHMSVAAADANTLVAAIDGSVIGTFANVACVRPAFNSNSVTIVWQRKDAAKSGADDLDVTFSSFSLSEDKSKSITSNITAEKLFGDNHVVMLGSDETYLAPDKLDLVSELSSRKYGLTATPVWHTNNKAVINEEGVVTAPSESGEFFVLTLFLLQGDYVVSEKSFDFFVKGENPSTNVNFIKNDRDPFTGEGATADTVFYFDKTSNSVVYDMGEKTNINRAALTSLSKNIGLVNKHHISLYASDDNKTYTMIESFSMLQTDNQLHFYNFDVEARYLKVHSSIDMGTTGRIVNSLQRLFTAESSDAPLLAEGEFSGSKTVTVKNNSNEKIYDKVATFSLADIGISESDLKSDMSDIRFSMDGAYLPHYYHGGNFYVRVLELEGGESADVDVVYGNKKAASVSDGNEVFEIQYGVKNAWKNNERGWFNSVATMPNGDLLKIVDFDSKLQYYRSTNGGLSWDSAVAIPGSEIVTECGGFIVDFEDDKVFFFAQYIDKDPDPSEVINPGDTKLAKYYIFLSEDSGHTWSVVGTPKSNKLPVPGYSLSYSDGIRVSTADGAGPEVDYVFTTGICRDQNTSAFCTGAMYSKDGGKTWIFSDSRINYNVGNSNKFEGGLSEETVFEQSDGTLVFYARCQIAETPHFAISYSKDKGITWSEARMSNVFTSNTQPIIEKLNGVPVLLWGGNNIMGGTSYMRFPLNLAYSDDEGETFKGIIDTSLQTVMATVDRTTGDHLHTNPDLTFVEYGGTDICYVVTTGYQMYIVNVEDYLYKTKGAFDSFEDGLQPEGWLTVTGVANVRDLGATDGDKALFIGSNTKTMRSIHYLEAGSVMFDCFVQEFGSRIDIELQHAYHDVKGVGAPIRIVSDDAGKLYCYTNFGESAAMKALGISLKEGDNTFKVDFDCASKKATLTVNGESADLSYIAGNGIGSSISYVTIFTGNGSTIALDAFSVIRDK